MLLFQAVSAIFGAFMMYMVRVHYRKGTFDNFEYGAWIAVWLSFIFLSIFPQTIKGVVETFNIGRVFDGIVILAFMVLSTVSFQNRVGLKRIEKKLERKIREEAIDQAKKKK